jgi:NADH-quinone oxidoreductase subunit E
LAAPDFTSPQPAYLPAEEPDRHVADEDLVWTDEERAQIDAWVKKYPTADGAVMWVLWLAQEKFGWLPAEVIDFVARPLDLPVPKVYGVATFYAMFSVEERPANVVHVCDDLVCRGAGGLALCEELERDAAPEGAVF